MPSILPGKNALLLFSKPDFRRFYVGNVTSLLGDGMASVGLSFAVLRLTGSATDLAYVLSARSIALVITLLAGGVIADRFTRHHIMIAADLIRVLSEGTTATLVITGHAQIWELMLLQAVHGMGTAAFNPAVTGLMPLLVDEDQLQSANALRGLAISSGYTIGPALAGVVVAATSPGWAIAADACTFAVSASQLARLRPRPATAISGGSLFHDLHSGWREFTKRKWLWTFTIVSSVSNMCYAAFLVLGPTILAQSREGAAKWSALLTALGIGVLLGGVVAIRVRPHRPLLAASLGIVLFALPTLGMATRSPVAVVAVLCLLAGAGTTLSNVLLETAIQRHVAASYLSKISAFGMFGSLAALPLGQVAAGQLAAGVGVFTTLWIAGSVQLVIALSNLTVPTTWQLRAWRDEDSPRRSADAQLGTSGS